MPRFLSCRLLVALAIAGIASPGAAQSPVPTPSIGAPEPDIGANDIGGIVTSRFGPEGEFGSSPRHASSARDTPRSS